MAPARMNTPPSTVAQPMLSPRDTPAGAPAVSGSAADRTEVRTGPSLRNPANRHPKAPAERAAIPTTVPHCLSPLGQLALPVASANTANPTAAEALTHMAPVSEC